EMMRQTDRQREVMGNDQTDREMYREIIRQTERGNGKLSDRQRDVQGNDQTMR
ncbi:unnamed protein product, partial [Candidula unifasciata]